MGWQRVGLSNFDFHEGSWGFPGGAGSKEPTCQCNRRDKKKKETQFPSLSLEDPLEKEMATRSSTLAWRIPWIEDPSGLQSMGLQRVEHDWNNLAR